MFRNVCFVPFHETGAIELVLAAHSPAIPPPVCLPLILIRRMRWVGLKRSGDIYCSATREGPPNFPPQIRQEAVFCLQSTHNESCRIAPNCECIATMPRSRDGIAETWPPLDDERCTCHIFIMIMGKVGKSVLTPHTGSCRESIRLRRKVPLRLYSCF